MPDTPLSNQALSTLRARQAAGGGAAALPAPAVAVAGPTAVPVNGSVPAALATPNVPLASPQAAGLVNNIRQLSAQGSAPPTAQAPIQQLFAAGRAGLAQAPVATPAVAPPAAPVAPTGGGIAGNLRALIDRASAAPPQRGTAFGRQNTDGINPQSLL